MKQTNPRWEHLPGDLLEDLRPQGRGLRERLEHGLRAAIQSRRLVAGAALPPTRVLAAELGISRSVVVAAYANLGADGYLEARQGAGTRVRHDDAHSPRPVALPPPWPRPVPALQMAGGLPDPALFPRTRWLRHYRAALAELPDPLLGYPDTRGAARLRDALSAYLGRVRGVTTDPRSIVVCTGATQGLTLACRALHRQGARRIAIEDPCFASHREAIAMTGLEPVPVALDEHGLDAAALEAHDVAAALVAPAHSYPTGASLGAGRRRDLIAWARRHGTLIIEDDYDAEFRYDRVPIGALQGLAPDHVIHLGSASKTVSPALRLGWVAAPPHLAGALEREKRLDDMGSGLLEQLAFARFVERGDLARYLRRVRPVYRARRDATIAALRELLPEVRHRGAAAGLHLHVTLPAGSDERAVARAAGRHGVVVEGAARHWADPAQAPPSLVLGYGPLSEPAIRRAIGVLAGVLRRPRA